jgi:hypothetical protein
MALDAKMLAGLRDLPVPDSLALLDDGVMNALQERQQVGSVSRAAVGACGALALGIGLASGALTAGPAIAGEAPLSLTSASALAPSSLLDSSQ